MTSAEFLLPRLGGLVPVLLDMERSGAPSPFKTRITSLLGQAAVMAGVLALMGRHDLAQARDYYELASAAGQASADGDLFLYAQGSMSFRDVRAGRLRDAVQRISAARDAAPGPASPTTLSWLASLGSELHARDGDESMSMRLIDEAERLCEEESHPDLGEAWACSTRPGSWLSRRKPRIAQPRPRSRGSVDDGAQSAGNDAREAPLHCAWRSGSGSGSGSPEGA
jgi:hypothetical protein